MAVPDLMRVLVTFLLLATALPPQARAADSVVLRVIPGTSDVHEPTQTSDGRLWFINRGHLCNYDGFAVSCPPSALRPSKLLALPNRELLVYERAPDRFLVVKGGKLVRELAARPISAEVQNLFWWRGQAWMAAADAIHTIAASGAPNNIEAKRGFVSLAVGPSDNLYGATASDIVKLTSTGSWQRVETNLALGGAITSFTVAPDNSMWIGTSSGLWHDGHVLPQNSQIEGSFHARPVEAVLVDREMNVWVPSASGLIHLRVNHPIQVFASAEGLGGEVPFSVVAAGPNNVWMADNAGGSQWQGDQFNRFSVPNGFTQIDLRTLALGAGGAVWFGGIGSGLWSLERGKARKVPLPLPMGQQGVRSLLRQEDKLWIALEGGGLGYLDNEGVFHQVGSVGAEAAKIGPMAVDGDTLWLGYRTGGFGRVRMGKLEPHIGETNDPVTCLLPLSGGALLGGTNGGGLFRFDQGQLEVLTEAEGLPSNRVHSLQRDNRERLWIGSDRGVSVVSAADVEQGFAGRIVARGFVTFDSSDGMRAAETVAAFFPPSALTADQKLWQPTVNGVAVFDTARLPEAPAVPAVSIEDVTIEGRPPSSRQPFFSVRSGRVEAVIEATTFINPHRLRLQYALSQAEAMLGSTEWMPATNNRYISLSGLSPGTYLLRARAFYNDNPARVREVVKAFTLRPPFYKMVPFYLTLGMLLVLGAALQYRRRSGSLERRHAVILAERRRISRDMHDSLQQDLVGLKFHIETALIKDELSPQTRLHLEQAAQLAVQGVRDLKVAIAGLVTDAMTVPALQATIAGHLNRLFAGSSVNASIQGQDAEGRVSVHAADATIHILRELMTNVFKHANASQLVISFKSSASALTIRVEDDGIGFDAHAGKADGGLQNIRLRAKEAKITVSFARGSSRGFCAELSVPLISGSK